MIIDDNKNLVEILKSRLTHAGFDVTAAGSGEQAIEQMKKQPPKLVLIDSAMPGLNGYDVLMRMKSDKKLKSIPVFMMAEEDQIESIERALNLGAENYIVKPFNPVTILDRIRKATGVR